MLDHPLLDLLAHPNEDGVEWRTITQSLARDYFFKSDAYLRIIPNNDGTPNQLQYLPQKHTKPKGGPRGVPLVVSYEYTRPGAAVGEKAEDIPADQVIHFRFGIDPDNPACGDPWLSKVLRIFTLTRRQETGRPII